MGESLGSIEVRKPVIDSQTSLAFPQDKIETQWKFITEITRRESLNDPNTRAILTQFCSIPLTELLPSQFLQSISSNNPHIKKLSERYYSEITNYLNLPSVPDNQIQPDITHAPWPNNPAKEIESISHMPKRTRHFFQEAFDEQAKSGFFTKGITREERNLIAKRYQYARDIKLLALGAEIINHGKLVPDSNEEIRLSSGTVINTIPEQNDQIEKLINPIFWEKRTQLKDRVYEIVIGGNKYILKERKTARHTDTKNHGHRDGRTSFEELAVANFFQQHGKVDTQQISLNWEQPLASVTYPDGFSFVIFKYETGLIDPKEIDQELTSAIVSHQDQFEEEYVSIKQKAEQLLVESAKKHEDQQHSSKKNLTSKLRRFFKTNTESVNNTDTTFKDFAKVKSLMLVRQAEQIMKKIIISNNYLNSDLDGFAYRINKNDQNQLKLEIIGFDFEYFEKIDTNKAKEIMDRQNLSNQEQQNKGIGFICWDDGTEVTPTQNDLYLALIA